MSCANRPGCCKRDPDRDCPKCFSDQVWVTPMPAPIVWKNYNTDLLKDGEGDATIGTCGTSRWGRDGSDGYDSHTYIQAGHKGFYFDETLVGTEAADSLPRPVVFNETGICNQFFGARLYPTWGVLNTRRDISLRVARALETNAYHLRLWGNFHLPSSPILASSYTKRYSVKIGGDAFGKDWDLDGYGLYNQSTGFAAVPFQELAQFGFTFVSSRKILGVNSNGIESGNVANDAAGPLNDRKIFFRLHDAEDARRYTDYDTGITLREFTNGEGITFNIDVKQTSVTPLGPLNYYTLGVDVTYSIPESQFILEESRVEPYKRCQTGRASLAVFSNQNRGFTRIPDAGVYDGPFQSQSQFVGQAYRVNTGDPAWWVNHLNSFGKENRYLFSWIDDFRVEDGTFDDDPAFVVSSFEHTDSGGVRKLYKSASDYGDVTIPDGTTIDVGEVETGDLFKLVLDNEGEQTTEVTITYDDPFITAVDDASPTLSPYEVQTVTFTGEELTADGTADIVLTHDQDGELIPSPWTLTLSGTAPDGPGAGGI